MVDIGATTHQELLKRGSFLLGKFFFFKKYHYHYFMMNWGVREISSGMLVYAFHVIIHFPYWELLVTLMLLLNHTFLLLFEWDVFRL